MVQARVQDYPPEMIHSDLHLIAASAILRLHDHTIDKWVIRLADHDRRTIKVGRYVASKDPRTMVVGMVPVIGNDLVDDVGEGKQNGDDHVVVLRLRTSTEEGEGALPDRRGGGVDVDVPEADVQADGDRDVDADGGGVRVEGRELLRERQRDHGVAILVPDIVQQSSRVTRLSADATIAAVASKVPPQDRCRVGGRRDEQEEQREAETKRSIRVGDFWH